MPPIDRPLIWRGFDEDGVECHIALEQWQQHVEKRPDIVNCLSLTIEAMQRADLETPDARRPDENDRRFRFVVLPDSQMPGYALRVSIKYKKQADGGWVKFYQSCWHERDK